MTDTQPHVAAFSNEDHSLHPEQTLLEHLYLDTKLDALDVATTQIDKILKRIHAKEVINDIFMHEAPPFSVNQLFSQLNCMYQSDAFTHDLGEEATKDVSRVQHEWEDGNETNPPPIDTYAAGIINLNKKQIATKIGSAQSQEMSLKMMGSSQMSMFQGRGRSTVGFHEHYLDDDMHSVTSFKTKISSMKKQIPSKRGSMQDVVAEPERIPVPLTKANDEDEIPEITYYRKLKQKEYDKKEEERKKEVAMKKKLEEMKKELRNREEELNKKAYTYDSKGDLIFQKTISGDTLPKDSNYELRFSLRKAPISCKGAYSFQKPQKQEKEKKRVVAAFKDEEEALQEQLLKEMEKKQPKVSTKNKYEILTGGKNLKQALTDNKPIKNIVIPMGSNFDHMEPDVGISIQELGRQKKGSLNFSTTAGQISRQEYETKFTKTMLNFSDKQKSFYKAAAGKPASSLSVPSGRNIGRSMSQPQGLTVEQSSLDLNTLHLTYQIGQDGTLQNFNSTQLLSPQNRNQIKANNINSSDILTNGQAISQSDLMLTAYEELMNQTQKSFLPDFKMNKTKSALSLHRQHIPKESTTETTLPPLKEQLEDFYLSIARNQGQALYHEDSKKKAAVAQKPRAQISSILKAAKDQQKKMSETMYSSQSQKSLLMNSRSRPFIEKVSSQNKNHLPPPPIGKTLGHGL